VASSRWPAIRRALWSVVLVLSCAVSAGVTGALIGGTTQSVAGDRNAPWIVGRAAGLSAYILLVLLVAMGLVLSHPGRTRIRRPSSATRIRLHVSLAVFTLVLIVLHVVVLATDSYAGVGWRGSVVPFGSSYRPVPVTLGVLGLYAGLLAGVTAALSGRRLIARIWWPIHKVAVVSFLLVWAHGLYAGVDTGLLLWLYLVTGLGLVALAIWRYAAQTPADLVRDLSDSPETAVRHSLRAVDSDVSRQSAG
jgi:Ferric reductase like transmembrane component